jgi:transcription initiation factor TFIID/TFIIF subunit
MSRVSFAPMLSRPGTNTRFPDGEFHVDLYTLPDQLIKMLWDFVNQKVNISEF